MSKRAVNQNQHLTSPNSVTGFVFRRAAIDPLPVHEVPAIVHEVLRSPGQPLGKAARDFMEPRFRHDFSGVRVHTDVKAGKSARAVNALAYTVGRNVVFDAGRYLPGTSAGDRLLAHELTHVIQQGGLAPSPGRLSLDSPASTHEHEAATAATALDRGQALPPASHTAPAIQRQPGPGDAPAADARPAARSAARALANPIFAADSILQSVLDGNLIISSGQEKQGKGKHIRKVQVALMNLGYSLPIYGADSRFGDEMASALGQFQHDNSVPNTEVIDAATMDALDKKTPKTPLAKYPEYAQLLGDGLLDFTVGVGYDEGGGFDTEIEGRRGKPASRTAIVPGLKKRGFAEKPAADADKVYAKVGIEKPDVAGGRYFIKPKVLSFQGNDIVGIVRLLTYKDPEVRKAFLEAMQKSDVSIYTGHGRYGSGPDFDPKSRGAGNILINPKPTVKDPGTAHMYSQLKKQGVTQPLPAMSFDQKYKIWFFDGCNTKHYMQSIRKLASVTPEKNDVLGWGSEISMNTTGADVLNFIDGLIARQSAQELIKNLNKINRIDKRFPNRGAGGEGLGDNPATP